MNSDIQKIYDNLSRFEKLQWKLGLGKALQNLPASKARREREEYWH